jgi:hypothetical protein
MTFFILVIPKIETELILLNMKQMFKVKMYFTYSFAARYSIWNKKQSSFDFAYRIAVLL